MKLLLLQDVETLGNAGDVVNVAGGYGRNYLIPKGLAVVADKGVVRQAEQIRKAAEKKRLQMMDGYRALADRISTVTLNFERRAGEQGKLYGSVTPADVAAALSERIGEEIDRRKLVIGEPLRQVGEHEVTVRLMGDISGMVRVVITAEGVEEGAEEGAEEAVDEILEEAVDEEPETEVVEEEDDEQDG